MRPPNRSRRLSEGPGTLSPMAEKLSLIESLSPEPPVGAVPGILRIRPVLVDSSSLVPDVVWSSRHGRPSRFLASLEFGIVRAFAAHHVWAEVPRKLRSENVLRGVDPNVAIAVWLNEYVPRIRFVDVSDQDAGGNPALAQRDASDTPTADVLHLIGPVVVLADDSDLVDLNLAGPNWREAVGQGYTMTVVAQQGWGALIVGRLGGHSGLELSKVIVRLARRPVGRFVLGCLAGATLLTAPRWLPRVQPRIHEMSDRMREIANGFILPIVAQTIEQYQGANRGWDERIRGVVGVSEAQAAARILASSPVPLSRTQLARLILPNGNEVARRRLVTRLAGALSSSNAFVAVDARRWQLGRAGANFGGVLDGAPILEHRPPRPPFELSAGAPWRTRSSPDAQPGA